MPLWTEIRTPASWLRLRDITLTEGPFVGAAGLYVLACWMLVAAVASGAPDPTEGARTTYWTLLLLTGGLYLSARAVMRVFQPRYRRRLLLTIVTSYTAVILIFAGTYYVFCALSDQSQARAIAALYDDWNGKNAADRAKMRLDPIDRRAFKSTESLWSVAGFDLNAWEKKDYAEAFTKAQEQGQRQLKLKFADGMRPMTLLDCLHFNVVTMTTTGYGDITPARLYSKLTADLQILFGLAILVIALGMLFGNWWRTDMVEEIRERIQLGEFDFRNAFWHGRSPALRTDEAIREEREAGDPPPVCPWCASPRTLRFPNLFTAPAAPRRYDPRRDVLTFVVLLSVATYLIYAIVPEARFASLPGLLRWTVSTVLIAIVAALMRIPLVLACDRIYAPLEQKWRAEYDDALTTYFNSWACEACRRLFIVPGKRTPP